LIEPAYGEYDIDIRRYHLNACLAAGRAAREHGPATEDTIDHCGTVGRQRRS
jgi:hypothetical protein